MNEEQEQALHLATEAGHILLENGAEISRVEETMERIANAYGVEDESFFVLSNGIIATGQHYARAEFIPIKGTQLEKVVEVNQLSREITTDRMPLAALRERLQTIRTMPGKTWWELIAGIACGVSTFAILFGGSLTDAAATFACGLMLGVFMAFVSPRLSRIGGNVLGGLVGGLLCIAMVSILPFFISHAPLTLHLPNMIIGTIIALVPGVPFTNGMRDLANEDYIAGSTRLTDAFLAFLCIALGVALAFIIEGALTGGIMALGVPVIDPVASHWAIQLGAAFVGTLGFSILFGAPRRFYLDCGMTGMIGWGIYLLVLRVASYSHRRSLCRGTGGGRGQRATVQTAPLSHHRISGVRHHPTGARRRYLLDGLPPGQQPPLAGCHHRICRSQSYHRHRCRHHHRRHAEHSPAEKRSKNPPGIEPKVSGISGRPYADRHRRPIGGPAPSGCRGRRAWPPRRTL